LVALSVAWRVDESVEMMVAMMVFERVGGTAARRA
jgi:hypothetical protein